MGVIRGSLETTVTLNKTTCYFLRTGRCSLQVVEDFYLSNTGKVNPSELFYCPRLYRGMKEKERMKPVGAIPCECGHAEIVSGAQRVCIAHRTGLQTEVRVVGEEASPLCSVCGRQLTFEEETAANQGGTQILTIKAVVKSEAEKKGK